MRNIRRHITAFLFFFALCCTTIAAQDSVRRTTPTAPPSVGAGVNNPNLTVPPIITPLQQGPPKPRRRRLTAADSIRLAAQRDSIARLTQIAQNQQVTPTNPNGSTFNTGTQTPNSTATATPTTVALATPEVPVLDSSANPFDILRSATRTNDSVNQAAATAKQLSENPLSAAPSLLNKQTYSKNFLFWIFLITLVLMAFVVSNARSAVQNAYQALLSDNALRQIHRDQIGWGNFGQFALYGLFWLNMGIFAFLMFYRFSGQSPYGQFATFMLCVGGVSLAFSIKHAILYLMASVFPIAKEVQLYNYIIIIGGIFLSLVLLPLNIFIAYSPDSLKEIFIYAAFGIIVLVYLMRSLRSLSVASPFLMTDQFHFLLYLCTVEIAPITILIKLLYL